MAIGTISNRSVSALKPGKTIWDQALKGFGIRCQKESKSYIVRYRAGRGRKAAMRLLTIGQHGSPWTPQMAREEATKVLLRVKLGEDPAHFRRLESGAMTVNELTDKYLEAAKTMPTRTGRVKAATTLKADHYRVNAHIRPALGTRRVQDLTRGDIQDFLENVAAGRCTRPPRSQKLRGRANARGGQGTATRTLGLLGAMLTYAVRLEVIEFNPVFGVQRYKTNVRTRRLSDPELKTMGELILSAYESPRFERTAGILHVLLLTGWRLGEVIGLRWEEIDPSARTARLTATKTGRSLRALPERALSVIEAQPRIQGNPYVFTGMRRSGAFGGFPHQFRDLRNAHGLSRDITAHILRHTFASIAAENGVSEIIIAELLGHSRNTVTSRYTHVADAALLKAAENVAKLITDRLHIAAHENPLILEPHHTCTFFEPYPKITVSLRA